VLPKKMQISLNECEEVVSAVADKLEVLRALAQVSQFLTKKEKVKDFWF
jgi:hypothetical protein